MNTSRIMDVNPLQDPEILLVHLERVDRRNHAWACYVESRSVEVQDGIDRLLRFAALKTGRVQDTVVSRCEGLQERLGRVLSEHGLQGTQQDA